DLEVDSRFAMPARDGPRSIRRGGSQARCKRTIVRVEVQCETSHGCPCSTMTSIPNGGEPLMRMRARLFRHARLPGDDESVSVAHQRGLDFIERMFPLRVLGLGLGFFMVAAVLYHNGAALPIWALLVFNGFGWPHLARWLARRSEDPRR